MHSVQHGPKFLSWKFMHDDIDKPEINWNMCCREGLHAVSTFNNGTRTQCIVHSPSALLSLPVQVAISRKFPRRGKKIKKKTFSKKWTCGSLMRNITLITNHSASNSFSQAFSSTILANTENTYNFLFVCLFFNKKKYGDADKI